MRPRVRSYGESSTATRSPGRMRMKFLRIFPEMWASTWCLFSSSTRNIAFGSGSTTVAITSMASSFPLPSVDFFFSGSGLRIMSSYFKLEEISFPLPTRPTSFPRPRKNPRPLGRDRDSVLEMRRITAIRGDCRPVVFQDSHARPARVHHRFDGKHHSFLKPRPLAGRAIIRELRILVHLGSDAVTNKFTHHRKTILLDPLLHRSRYVSKTIACANLVNPLLQRFARHPKQFLPLRGHFPDRHRQRRIRKVTVELDTEIKSKNASSFHFPQGRRNPV